VKITYIWAGKYLGGFSDIREEEIKNLAELQKGKTVCLMCMERDPMSCHRETEIGRRLKAYGIAVEHLV
ncbi:MAG: DUF488 family protein, partial [Candidatus Hydrogenedentota bacterium]